METGSMKFNFQNMSVVNFGHVERFDYSYMVRFKISVKW